MSEGWKEIAEHDALSQLRLAMAPRILEIERVVLHDSLTEVELARLQGEYRAYESFLNLPRLKVEQAESSQEYRRKLASEIRPYTREVR